MEPDPEYKVSHPLTPRKSSRSVTTYGSATAASTTVTTVDPAPVDESKITTKSRPLPAIVDFLGNFSSGELDQSKALVEYKECEKAAQEYSLAIVQYDEATQSYEDSLISEFDLVDESTLLQESPWDDRQTYSVVRGFNTFTSGIYSLLGYAEAAIDIADYVTEEADKVLDRVDNLEERVKQTYAKMVHTGGRCASSSVKLYLALPDSMKSEVHLASIAQVFLSKDLREALKAEMESKGGRAEYLTMAKAVNVYIKQHPEIKQIEEGSA